MDKNLAAKTIGNPETARHILAAATGREIGELTPVITNMDIALKRDPSVIFSAYTDADGAWYGICAGVKADWLVYGLVAGDRIEEAIGEDCNLPGSCPIVIIGADEVELAEIERLDTEFASMLRNSRGQIPEAAEPLMAELRNAIHGDKKKGESTWTKLRKKFWAITESCKRC